MSAAAVSPALRLPAARRWAASLAEPRRALCVAVLLISFSACLDVLHDPDLWWHIRAGRWILDNHRIPSAELFSYTAAGNALTAHEWLPEVLFAILDRVGGVLLIALASAAVAWSGFLALALRAHDRGAGPIAIAIGIGLGAKAAEVVLGSRPQVATFALACWTLLLAERHLERGGRRRWALPVLFLLWANLHAGFVIGLGLLAAVVAVEAVKRRMGLEGAAPRRRIEQLAVVTALCALAACVNPAGPGLYRFALSVSASESSKAITEWQSPDFHEAGALALLVLITTFVLLAGWQGRVALRDSVLASLGIGLALLAVRNTALCVATVLPAWSATAGRAGTSLLSARASALTGAPNGSGRDRIAATSRGHGIAARYRRDGTATTSRRDNGPGSRREGAPTGSFPDPVIDAQGTDALGMDGPRTDGPGNAAGTRETQSPGASEPTAPSGRGAQGAVGAAVAAVAIAVGVAGTSLAIARSAREASAEGVAAAYPACAAALLARAPAPQRVFADYGSAGYLIGRAWPAVTVYEYGESISLGRSVFDDYQRIAGGALSDPSARALLSASRTDAVLIPDGALSAVLDTAPDWRRVVRDGRLALFIRAGAPWAASAAGRC